MFNIFHIFFFDILFRTYRTTPKPKVGWYRNFPFTGVGSLWNHPHTKTDDAGMTTTTTPPLLFICIYSQVVLFKEHSTLSFDILLPVNEQFWNSLAYRRTSSSSSSPCHGARRVLARCEEIVIFYRTLGRLLPHILMLRLHSRLCARWMEVLHGFKSSHLKDARLRVEVLESLSYRRRDGSAEEGLSFGCSDCNWITTYQLVPACSQH